MKLHSDRLPCRFAISPQSDRRRRAGPVRRPRLRRRSLRREGHPVEGIQRTEAGTVFSYLPVRVGETFDDDKGTAAIKALYATGFFKDVRLEEENGVLVVLVEERPAIQRSTSPAPRNSRRTCWSRR
jgi:hypothetical protein